MLPHWADTCKEIKDFHDAMKAKCSEFNTKWTLQDTADHFKIGKSTVSENLRIAAALEDNLVHHQLTRDEALEIACDTRVKFLFFCCRYKNKNALYLRADTNVPYIFAYHTTAEEFCSKIKVSENIVLEPVRVELKTIKYKGTD